MLKARAARYVAATAVLAWVLAGCARATLVLPVELGADVPTPRHDFDAIRGYEAAVRVMAAVIAGELGLRLPHRFTVFVYPTRAEYEGGLVRDGRLPPGRAARVAGYSVALGQPRRLFINDEALRGVPRRVWLSVVAHELTHLAQYELSGGRRGKSEQWLREGMADWVAARVLDRLGEDLFLGRRQRLIGVLARRGRGVERAIDLVDLGRPLRWEARHLASDERPLYPLAFLLVDDLVRRRGFESLIVYLRAFADSDDRFGQFHRAFGLSLAEFEALFSARLRDEIEGALPQAACEPLVAPEVGGEIPVIVDPDRCSRYPY